MENMFYGKTWGFVYFSQIQVFVRHISKKKIDSSIKLIRNPDDRGKVLNIHISLALLDVKFSIQKILLHHNLGGNCN